MFLETKGELQHLKPACIEDQMLNLKCLCISYSYIMTQIHTVCQHLHSGKVKAIINNKFTILIKEKKGLDLKGFFFM